jgi:hypothetical protein
MRRAGAALTAAAASMTALTVVGACKPGSPAPAAPPREESAAPRETSARPTLLLLTTLPLMFGESFGLEGNGSPALDALETRYVVRPLAVADAKSLAQGQLLLMAHPLAQPAEALVDLDAWVRGGGRLLLLADPALDWHSDLPLSDSRRAPPAFADTGLLRHWGLRLDAPDERGPMQRRVGGYEIVTVSPGTLVGRCAITEDRAVARCRIGEGQVTVVADADFLNVEDLDGPTEQNLGAMLAELATLEMRP